jgi:hypothetical protein
MPGLSLKSVTEIKAKLRDLLHRAGNKFIKDRLVPCPMNCTFAPKVGNKVQQCPQCKANPNEPCKLEPAFKPRYVVADLKDMFQDLLKNREWVLRTHRDVAMLLWVLGQLEPNEEPNPTPLPPHLLKDPGDHGPPGAWLKLDGDTLQASPDAILLLTAFLQNLPQLLDKVNAMDGRTLGQGSDASSGGTRIPIPKGAPGGQDHQPGEDHGQEGQG